MFVVIYRGYLKPNIEKEYLASWHLIADYFVKNCGALGSTLHKAEDGMYLAYSKWPDKETRDKSWGESASFAFPDHIQNAIITLKNCRDPERLLPEIQLEMVDEISVANKEK